MPNKFFKSNELFMTETITITKQHTFKSDTIMILVGHNSDSCQ